MQNDVSFFISLFEHMPKFYLEKITIHYDGLKAEENLSFDMTNLLVWKLISHDLTDVCFFP